MAEEDVTQDDGVVVRLVTGCVNQRHWTLARQVANLVQVVRMLSQLRRKSLLKFFPSRRIVPEPFSQCCTGRDFFKPFINLRLVFLQTPRPEAIN